MKVEQLFACHRVSEERKVPLATLSFQGNAMYWWTSLERERRLHREPPIEYWNDLRGALRRRHIPSYYHRELMDKLQRLQQKSPREIRVDLPHFYGKEDVEVYLDWEMKVEQLFACHRVSEERKVPLATLSFQSKPCIGGPL